MSYDISHIEAIKEEFKEIEENKGWNQIYEKVRLEGSYDLSCSAALKPPNKNLNRYKDVLPYDHSRIILQASNTDYVNASLVKVESIGRRYILSQGPLAHTTPHFWLLIWQQETRGIVMLNKIMEKNQIKCHQYWPLGKSHGGENICEYPSVNLKIEFVKEECHSHYIHRTLRLTNTSTKENREILHFHYTTWSDFGVPQSPDAFYKFLSVVRTSECLESKYGPAVIHCSAGIGRSGTFCLVDSILLMLNRGLCSGKPGKVLEVLVEMRKYRMGLIQTSDQLRFSYQAIIYGAQKQLSSQTNGKNPAEESSSSEEVSLEEEAPPLPPPRTDSLTRSMLESELNDATDDDSDGDDDETFPQDELIEETRSARVNDSHGDLDDSLGQRPLPSEPSSTATSPTSPPESDVIIPSTKDAMDDADETAVRRRRQERVAATSAKVAEIKEKARAAERWEERKRRAFAPLSVCAALLILGVGGGLLYYYRQFHAQPPSA